MKTKTCPQCHSPFTPKYKSQRFCSRHCVAQSKSKPPVYNVCEVCGVRFETNRHDLERGYGRFCSRDCANVGKVTRIETICEHCGKPFEQQPSEGFRFCSHNCAIQSRKQYAACIHCGKEFWVKANCEGLYCSNECFHKEQVKRVERTCLNCGVTFTARHWDVTNGMGGNYCNRDCLYEAMRSPDCEYIGFTESLKEEIRERDGRTCQLCGLSSADHYRRLDVHHINYIKHDCHPGNLISLCTTCHPKTNLNRNVWLRYFQYIMKYRNLT